MKDEQGDAKRWREDEGWVQENASSSLSHLPSSHHHPHHLPPKTFLLSSLTLLLRVGRKEWRTEVKRKDATGSSLSSFSPQTLKVHSHFFLAHEDWERKRLVSLGLILNFLLSFEFWEEGKNCTQHERKRWCKKERERKNLGEADKLSLSVRKKEPLGRCTRFSFLLRRCFSVFSVSVHGPLSSLFLFHINGSIYYLSLSLLPVGTFSFFPVSCLVSQHVNQMTWEDNKEKK